MGVGGVGETGDIAYLLLVRGAERRATNPDAGVAGNAAVN